MAGGANYVNSFPFFNVQVVKQQCQLTTDRNNYLIPLGGSSPPIIIDFQTCFPALDLRVTLVKQPELTDLLPNPQSLIFQ